MGMPRCHQTNLDILMNKNTLTVWLWLDTKLWMFRKKLPCSRSFSLGGTLLIHPPACCKSQFGGARWMINGKESSKFSIFPLVCSTSLARVSGWCGCDSWLHSAHLHPPGWWWADLRQGALPSWVLQWGESLCLHPAVWRWRSSQQVDITDWEAAGHTGHQPVPCKHLVLFSSSDHMELASAADYDQVPILAKPTWHGGTMVGKY